MRMLVPAPWSGPSAQSTRAKPFKNCRLALCEDSKHKMQMACHNRVRGVSSMTHQRPGPVVWPVPPVGPPGPPLQAGALEHTHKCHLAARPQYGDPGSVGWDCASITGSHRYDATAAGPACCATTPASGTRLHGCRMPGPRAAEEQLSSRPAATLTELETGIPPTKVSVDLTHQRLYGVQALACAADQRLRSSGNGRQTLLF